MRHRCLQESFQAITSSKDADTVRNKLIDTFSKYGEVPEPSDLAGRNRFHVACSPTCQVELVSVPRSYDDGRPIRGFAFVEFVK